MGKTIDRKSDVSLQPLFLENMRPFPRLKIFICQLNLKKEPCDKNIAYS